MAPTAPLPPVARRAEGEDPYAWLQERDTDAVLDYLKAENAYQEAQLADQAQLREQLFEEIKGRIRETDLSLASPWGQYLYYTRTTAGDEYARHYRCPRPADDSPQVDETHEQLLLDPNVLAAGGFLALGAYSVSPDQQRLAYSLDTSGEETYRLYVKELASGAVSELPFEHCDGSMTWANDSQTLFFGELDDTHRPYKLYRHRLGSEGAELVFEEPDGRFFLHCYRSSSERQLILLLNSKTTSEAWVLDAQTPAAAFTCLAPREEAHEYYPDHGQLNGTWTWFIRSNQTGINFALYQAPDTGSAPLRAAWQTLIEHRPDSMLESVTLNAQAYSLSLRDHRSPSARYSGLPRATARRSLQPLRLGQPGVCQRAYSPALRGAEPPCPGAPIESGRWRPTGTQGNPGAGPVQCRRLPQPTPMGDCRRWHPGTDQPGPAP
jgi:oligopeptidase B